MLADRCSVSLASVVAATAWMQVATPVGSVTLASDGQALVGASFGTTSAVDRDPHLLAGEAWLKAFFLRSLAPLPKLGPTGTQFQMEVWAQTSAVRFGQTKSYRDIATALGKPGASRAYIALM